MAKGDLLVENQISFNADHCFLVAIGAGIALSILWLAFLIGAGLWCRVWAWIDDAQAPKRNVITQKIMKYRGFHDDGGHYMPYRRNGSHEDGMMIVLSIWISLIFLPSLILIAFWLYPVTIGAFTLYLLARLARFVRRHKKLFDKHIADPDAHKN